jgi:hypothetical protein
MLCTLLRTPQGRLVPQGLCGHQRERSMREIVPGRLPLGLNSAKAYDGNGNGPLSEAIRGPIGEIIAWFINAITYIMPL